MLIPQAMAYALLAGMPPVYGLYASIVPCLAYAILGSSRQLAIGPVAIDSLLVAAGLGSLAVAGSNQYIFLAAVLAIFVGVLQITMGLLRLGFLANFLSKSVISGFTSAAAVVIGMSQVKNLLDIDIPNSPRSYEVFYQTLLHIGETNLISLAIGVGSIVLLILGKRYARKLPNALLIVIAMTAIVAIFRLDRLGVSILRDIPSGLPAFSVPDVSLSDIKRLLPIAITLSLIGYVDAISIVKVVASKTRQRIDANQEFIGLGASNVLGGFFSAFPVGGSFTRSIINYQAGARTQIASVIAASGIALTVIFFTKFFFYLPKAVLAAIIVMAVASLFDYKDAIETLRFRRSDGLALIMTFLVTVLVGVPQGILSGVIFNILIFVWRSATPRIVELGRVTNTNMYRDVNRYKVVTSAEVVILRLDGALYFANVNRFEERLIDLISSRPDVDVLLLNGSSITDLDASGEAALHNVADFLDNAGVAFHIANLRGPIRDTLVRSGFWEKLGEDHFHHSIHDALLHIELTDKNKLIKPVDTIAMAFDADS